MKIFQDIKSYESACELLNKSGKKWLLRKDEIIRNAVELSALDNQKKISIVLTMRGEWENFYDMDMNGSFKLNAEWLKNTPPYEPSLRAFIEKLGFDISESLSFTSLNLNDWTHRLGLLFCLYDKRLTNNPEDICVQEIQAALHHLLQGKKSEIEQFINYPYYHKLMSAFEKRIKDIRDSYSPESLERNQKFVIAENNFVGKTSVTSKKSIREMSCQSIFTKSGCQIDLASEQGRRKNQEDRLAALQVSVDQSWENSIPELLSIVLSCSAINVYRTLDYHDQAGTTATLLFSYKGKLYTAWIGDSAAILLTKDQKTQEIKASYLNWPHRIDEKSLVEKKASFKFEEGRIIQEGGRITKGITKSGAMDYRLYDLQTTRNIGNDSGVLISDNINVARGAGSSDIACITEENISNDSIAVFVCSDGLTDALSREEIAEEISKNENANINNENANVNIAEKLVNKAYDKGNGKGSGDNITVAYVKLNSEVKLNSNNGVVVVVCDGHTPLDIDFSMGGNLAGCAAFFAVEIMSIIAKNGAENLNESIQQCLNLQYPNAFGNNTPYVKGFNTEPLQQKGILPTLNFIATQDRKNIRENNDQILNSNNSNNNNNSSAPRPALRRTYSFCIPKSSQEPLSKKLKTEQDETSMVVSENLSDSYSPSSQPSS